MDYDLFKIVGGIAGFGGVALASVVYIFREIIRKEIFPQLTKEQAYKLLNRIIILIFIIGLLGIIAYIIVASRNGNPNSPRTQDKQTPPSTPVVSTTAQTPSPTPIKLDKKNAVRNVKEPSSTLGIARLSGFVFDENGKPLQGAKISIVDFPEVKTVDTASNGSFKLENIPRNKGEGIRIRVTLEGYVTNVRDVVIGEYPRTITLEKIK
jgi:hypothetical protein